MVRKSVPAAAVSVGTRCARVVSATVTSGDEYSYDPWDPNLARTVHVYAVLTVRPDTVAADVVAAMAVQPLFVGLAVGSHLYSKCVATVADGLSSQSSAISVPPAVAEKPVGRHGPLVLCVTAVGAAEVKPDFWARIHTVKVVPELRLAMIC